MTPRHTLAESVALTTSLPLRGVAATISLLDEGATIPFISRYRKEATGELDEVQIAHIAKETSRLRELDKRREYVLSTIEASGKLTPDLKNQIETTLDATELEDLFAPFRPKKRTRAAIARERGLEPLAAMIMSGRCSDAVRASKHFINKDVPDSESAIAGAKDIMAEWISDNARVRGRLRKIFSHTTRIESQVSKGKEQEASNYANYNGFSRPLGSMPSHNYLAIRRGEREGLLKVTLDPDNVKALDELNRIAVRRDATDECASLIGEAAADSYRRLIRPGLETEMHASAKARADSEAIALFGSNLEQLLLTPPLSRKRILAIDPGYRTGCKVVCLDQQGNLLHHDVIYPVPPRNDISGSESKIKSLVSRYEIDAIAIGNGTAGRETETFIRNIGLPDGISIHSVNESGASIYSASAIAREELPDQDVTVRGAVSIGRRLLDPLAELVKIDPQSIGVGQYQHDVDQTALREALDFTVSSCVNRVGVNLNTASARLLSYVSGIGPATASKIVEYRRINGDFKSRSDLKKVPRLGDKTYQQCAGFLRIPESDNTLDNTAVHPQDYKIVERMAKDLNVGVGQLAANSGLIDSIDLSRYVTDERGLPTLRDIISELRKPGRDPRTESEQSTVYSPDIKSIEDVQPGMELTGTVNNITAFGAFVDIGIKESGLVHVSQMSERYVSSPLDVVCLNKRVRVRILDVDLSRKRISLTMKGVTQ